MGERQRQRSHHRFTNSGTKRKNNNNNNKIINTSPSSVALWAGCKHTHTQGHSNTNTPQSPCATSQRARGHKCPQNSGLPKCAGGNKTIKRRRASDTEGLESQSGTGKKSQNPATGLLPFSRPATSGPSSPAPWGSLTGFLEFLCRDFLLSSEEEKSFSSSSYESKFMSSKR